MLLFFLKAVAVYYKHGSGRELERLLRRPELSRYNNVKTRLQLSVDYVKYGVRVQCDGLTPRKLLAQYLITDDFHLFLNDIDELTKVTEKGGCQRRPKMSLPLEKEAERRGWQNKSEPLRFNLRPTYLSYQSGSFPGLWKVYWVA